MDEGREGGEVTVNPAILGPNRRPANITQWTIHDPHGNVIQTTDVVMAKLFIGSRSEH